jgi:hypothetical protein
MMIGLPVIFTFWGRYLFRLFGAIIGELITIFQVFLSRKRGFLNCQLNWLVCQLSIYEEL